MPMYDFECEPCGIVFEDIIPSTAPPPACPQCGKATAKLPGMPLYAKGKPVNPKLAKARYDWKNSTRDERKKQLGDFY